MTGAHHEANDLRGTTFRRSDLRDARFVECDLRGIRIVGSEVDDVHINAFAGSLGSVTVEGVDVTPYVLAELDRRQPERVSVRDAHTADELRAAWDAVERGWAMTVERAAALPEPRRHERVDGEWSFVETLRHLVFAVDVWLHRMLLGQADAYHPFGIPPDEDAAADAVMGIDRKASVSFADALALHEERRRRFRSYLRETVTDASLDAERTAEPAPPWGVETRPVRACVRVVLREHVEHRRYAERDLDRLLGG